MAIVWRQLPRWAPGGSRSFLGPNFTKWPHEVDEEGSTQTSAKSKRGDANDVAASDQKWEPNSSQDQPIWLHRIEKHGLHRFSSESVGMMWGSTGRPWVAGGRGPPKRGSLGPGAVAPAPRAPAPPRTPRGWGRRAPPAATTPRAAPRGASPRRRRKRRRAPRRRGAAASRRNAGGGAGGGCNSGSRRMANAGRMACEGRVASADRQGGAGPIACTCRMPSGDTTTASAMVGIDLRRLRGLRRPHAPTSRSTGSSRGAADISPSPAPASRGTPTTSSHLERSRSPLREAPIGPAPTSRGPAPTSPREVAQAPREAPRQLLALRGHFVKPRSVP